MAFKKPSLFVPVDTEDYQSEIDSNFRNVDTAFTQIQNELLKLSGVVGSSGVSNLQWIDRLLQANGPIGFDSWNPVFTETTDGIDFQLRHNLVPGRRSHALIGQLIHHTNTEQTWSLDSLIPNSGDGPFRIVVGLNSAGAPALEQVVVHNEALTDDPELVLFTFDVIRETDGIRAINLRRETLWHANDAAWAEARDRPHYLQARLHRVDIERWPGDDTHAVFIVPFDCRVTGIRAYLGEDIPDNQSITVRARRKGWGTAPEDVHQGQFVFGNATDALALRTVHSLAANDPETQLAAGDYVNVILDPSWNPSTSNPPEDLDLTVQLELVPIQHDPRKQNP